MRNKRILRFMGIAVVLILVTMLVPLSGAAGAITLTLTPTTQMVGGRINFTGSGYPIYNSTDILQYYCDIYVTDQPVAVNNLIDTTITRYLGVGIGTFIEDSGTISGYFNVPATLNQGISGIAAPLTLTAGLTYNVAITDRYPYSSTLVQNKTVRFVTSFMVAQGPGLDALSPASGTAGTSVQVSGFNFPGGAALTYKVDTTVVTPVSGSTTTTTGGAFLGIITIPAGTAAGAHTITVTAGTTSASKTFTVSPPASLSPLSPITGPAGTDIIVMGANFPANGTLAFKFDAATVTPKAGSPQAGGDGSFTSIITVPATSTAGAFLVTVTSGTISVTATFTVTETAPPTTTPPATTPPATTPPATTPPATTPPATTPPATSVTPSGTGTLDFLTQPDASGTVSLFGTGYTPSGQVVFKYDGVQVAIATATSKGIVSAQITLPASTHGDHQISASDGPNTGVLSYTVESVPPAVPAPLAPAMNAKLKAPITFKWGPVTDPSLPVTYNLQISTDSNFATASIIINKTKLTKIEYTLTELEAAQLSNAAATYYWREQAVDGAQNASPWTGAGAFTVTQPLKFTSWPMYATMAGLFVVGFLIGLLLGRRTAFSY